MVSGLKGFEQADHLERDFLLRRAGDLLPFQRNENLAPVLLGNGIDHVLADAEALAQVDLLSYAYPPC